MRINQLSCCADSCENYKNGYCSLSSIEVAGVGAQSSASTCCNSFEPQSGRFTSQNKLESPYADIRCSAKECVYNSENSCTANYVDIAGHAATVHSDTLCSTFRMESV